MHIGSYQPKSTTYASNNVAVRLFMHIGSYYTGELVAKKSIGRSAAFHAHRLLHGLIDGNYWGEEVAVRLFMHIGSYRN